MGTDTVEACYGSNTCDDSTIEWQNPAVVYLNPVSATCPIGQPHNLHATVKRVINLKEVPVVGIDVTFKVISGPNVGILGTYPTDSNGVARAQCKGTGTSTGQQNTFEACIADNNNVPICSDGSVVWQAIGIGRLGVYAPANAPRKPFLRGST